MSEQDNENRSGRGPRRRTVVLMTAPALDAVSGVSSHVRELFESPLAGRCRLLHFQAGSEGRRESPPARLARVLRDPFRLYAQVRAGGADLVHVNGTLRARAWWRDLLLMLAARAAGAAVVFQVHGGALPARFFRGGRAGRSLLRLALRLPDCVVTLGRDEAAAWRAFLPGGTVRAVPNAIDTRPYRVLERRPAGEGRRLEILYLGRLAAGKGLPELLQAVASPALARRRPRLTIAGSGPARAALQSLADTLGIGNDVVFAGAVFGEAKLELLARADLFALPSYSEGLPYALLEAMAAGLAVLATPVGAIPDVLRHGEHGLLVRPRDAQAVADALLALDADRPRLRALAAAGRRRVFEAFDRQRLVADLAALYDELATPAGARSLARA